MANEFLSVYLKDQHALGVVWRELAKRAAKRNRGTEVGEALSFAANAIAEDVATFRAIMRDLSVRPNPIKTAVAVGAERAGRLKLNRRISGYSPLSRFEELEALTMGIDGKKQLWTTLRDIAGLGARLPDVDFDRLIQRAEQQRAVLEPSRLQAGASAFGSQFGHLR
jgi:hypothetical protein